MSRGDSGPRPYLRAEERRTQLLAAAAALIGRDGLGSLTVAGVGVEAGVSRQWVYEHFSDLDDLYRALILDRFAALDATIDAARRRLTGIELATFAARQVFVLVPADRRILRALVDGAGWNRPELAGIEAELRERILGRWTGFVRSVGHDDLGARTIVWAIVNAVFGLADQIEREGLGVEQAVALLGVLIGAFVEPPTSGHRPRRRSSVAGGDRQRAAEASHAH
jgi:AcrR family transcriptional regulator